MKVPRAKAVLKWTGLSLCVLIFAVWFASGWYFARLSRHTSANVRYVMAIACGRACWYSEIVILPVPAHWYADAGASGPMGIGWAWLPERIGPGFNKAVHVPLHIPFLLFALPTALLFYRDRRSVRWAREGRCTGCGYDIAGLAAGSPCPECGKGPA